MPSEELQKVESLQRYRDDWRRLARESTYSQPEWQFAWGELGIPSNCRLSVHVCSDDSGRLLAVLPLYFHTLTRRLRWMGEWKGMACCFSLLEDDAGSEIDAVREITASLVRSLKSIRWKSLCLESLSVTNPSMQRWYAELLAQGFHVVSSSPRLSYEIELNDGLEAWLQNLSASMQIAFQRIRKFQESLRVRWVHDLHDWEEFVPVFLELWSQTQKNQPISKSAGTIDPRDFLDRSCKELLLRNQLQAFSLWHENRPLIAEIGVRTKKRWHRCMSARSDSPDDAMTFPGITLEELSIVYMTCQAERFGIEKIHFVPLSASELYAVFRPVPLETWTITRPGVFGSAQALFAQCRSKWQRWTKKKAQ